VECRSEKKVGGVRNSRPDRPVEIKLAVRCDAHLKDAGLRI
jgi:hypothetical protein